MTVVVRKRLPTRPESVQAGVWHEQAPTRRFPLVELAFGTAALLGLAWWLTAAEPLVGSASREGGRVLSCKYLAGTRVVERQYLAPADGPGPGACPLVRFG